MSVNVLFYNLFNILWLHSTRLVSPWHPKHELHSSSLTRPSISVSQFMKKDCPHCWSGMFVSIWTLRENLEKSFFACEYALNLWPKMIITPSPNKARETENFKKQEGVVKGSHVQLVLVKMQINILVKHVERPGHQLSQIGSWSNNHLELVYFFIFFTLPNLRNIFVHRLCSNSSSWL